MRRTTYQGKYSAKTNRRHRGIIRLLYAVNILLLAASAFKAFSAVEEARLQQGMFPTAGATTVETPQLPNPVSPTQLGGDIYAPEIHGVRDLQSYEGEPISYRMGITVTDDQDLSPVLTVDSSQVDLTRVGSYTVTYHAEDSSGNRSSAIATVTVLPREENFVDMADVYAAVDAALGVIITDDMDAEAQVRAISAWCWKSCRYAGHSDRGDWRQAAHTMLTTGTGDCYGFFAVSKLMFERLGIPNIDVVKVKNSETDSEHFWSLVSVDGGETYYHFDATPRLGQTEPFCLVTDRELDDYSESHNGSHNRDTSLYPATPEE